MSDDNKKDKKDNGSFVKGLFTGLGAALGIAALGIGGKFLYDSYKEETPEDKKPEKEEEKQQQEDEKIENNNISLEKSNTMPTNDEDETEGKDSFICPINQTLMKDPVITPYGTTYERSAILNWLKNHNTDPLTKKKLSKEMLITNYALKSAIEYYRKSLNNK